MKYYSSICRQIVAINRKLPRNKQIPAVRVSKGKYGKPKRYHKFKVPKHATNIVINSDMKKPMPWGARYWIEWDG